MRLFAIVLAGLAVAGCASPEPYRVDYTFTELAVLPFDEALGLTSAEIAQRLGFKPSPNRPLISAELTHGVLVEATKGNAVFGESACPKGAFSTIRRREGAASVPFAQYNPPEASAWVFEDGRYVGDGAAEQRPGVDGRPPVYFVSACYEMRESGGGARPVDYLALPLAAPYLVVVGTLQNTQPDRIRGQVTDRDVNKTLSTLSLGAPPPGGLDAWLANLPPHVMLISQEAGATKVSVNKTMPNARADDITLRVYTQHAKSSGDVVATFEHGVATKFERGDRPDNRHLCHLTSARSFQCVETPPGPKRFLDLTMTR